MADILHIDAELDRLCREYDLAVKDLARACEADARAGFALELAKAKAYLRAEGTIPEKQARVAELTERESLEAKLTDAYREAARARVKAIDKQLSVLQTRASLERSEREFTRYPAPADQPSNRYQLR
jgi:hypothetical protein